MDTRQSIHLFDPIRECLTRTGVYGYKTVKRCGWEQQAGHVAGP